jgi:hypothetical protein
LFLATQIQALLAPFPKSRWATHPLLGFYLKKTVHFQGKLFTSNFLQAAVAGPILGIDFLRKFKVTVSPEINQIQFSYSTAAQPTNFLPSATPVRLTNNFVRLAFFV